MNIHLSSGAGKVWGRLCFPVIAILSLLSAGPARAGLTVDMHLYHDTYGYYFYPFLSTNTTAPAIPSGVFRIASWQYPTNGSALYYNATPTSFDYGDGQGNYGGGTYYNDFDSFMYGITNAAWSILVTNSTSTNLYLFKVTVSNLASNGFGAPAMPVYPTNGQAYVANTPTFQWSGPAGWAGSLFVEDLVPDTNGNNNYVTSEYLSPDATTWTPSVVLPNGTNDFYVDYYSNSTAQVVAAQPTNHAGQAISGWTSTSTLETHFTYDPLFNVGQPANDFDPFLVARYDFEIPDSPGTDSSGNGNDPDCGSASGPNQDVASTNAAVGNYARQYFGDTSFCFTQNDPAYNNLSNAMSGNFTVTAWVNTTNTVNSDYANAYFGAPIFFAGADYNDYCTIPLSITGSKAAFTIVENEAPGTVILHSTTSVNDGRYHFLAVTRQQSTGLMCLYVDGNLEATGTSFTTPVVTQGYISVAGGYYQFSGLLDDVRLYSTNLSAADLATVEASGNIPTLASAVGASNLPFSTSGDANWSVENTNTYNGEPYAAQSGSIMDYQVSTLTATVTGPGSLTFVWSSQDSDPNQYLDYEFAIDDLDTNDIADLYGGYNDWQSVQDLTGGPIPIGPGQHTLIWQVYADGDEDPNAAGYLADVVFTSPDTRPVSADITLNIYREQDPTFGDAYIAFPSFNSITPAGTGTMTNIVQSPNGYFSGHNDQGGGGSSSAILGSLDSVLNECTNGLWSLYINYGLANQRQFQFKATISGLTTNVLSPVQMIVPTNGAVGFPSTAAIQWAGPSNYSTLTASKSDVNGGGYVGVNLPITATSWTPGGLDTGTNECTITYTSNNFPNVSFSVPVDMTDSQTVAVWSAEVNLVSTAQAIFVVTAGPASVHLVNTLTTGTNCQFSFQSQSGFTNTIQYRTNLILGTWQTYTNIAGDGNLKTNQVPLSVFGTSKQGFIRVGTQ